MLDRIIRFSLGNRLLILALSMLLLTVGLWRASRAEVDVFPDLNAPTVTVMTECHGMAAEEVERLVTYQVETAVNGASRVRRVRSTSTSGFSVVWVEFDWGMDAYRARQIVSERIASLGSRLPQGVDAPILGPQSSILGEMLIVSLTADSTSMMDLRSIAEWEIRPRLLGVEGVSSVSVLGGARKQYQIQLSPGRMRQLGVSMEEVIRATESMNSNISLGTLNEYGNEYVVRGVSATADLLQLSMAPVQLSSGGSVRLGDIAEIRCASEEPIQGAASERTRPAVLLTVTKQPQTDTSHLTQALLLSLEELRSSLPPDVGVSTDSFRQQRFIDASIRNVRNSLLEGGLFVVIVLLLFLGNLRTTLISLASMPLALLTTVLVLDAMGLTLNTMSLGGMAIAIGSLVDDAIVDVENVWKRLRRNRALEGAQRQGVLQVVFEASREVRLPILNSTLIIVASFCPLFLLDGMEGRMLIPLGIAFITSLAASTLVALTLTPVLCSLVLGRQAEKAERGEMRHVLRLKEWYQSALRCILDHKKPVIIVALTLLVLSAAGFLTLGSSFLPSFNEGSFTVNVSLLPGISLEESDRVGRMAEQILLEVDEVTTVVRKTGRAELDEHSLGVNVSELEVPFVLRNRPRKEVEAEVREKLSRIPGANIEIGQPISHRIDAMLSGTESSIAVKIFGPDLTELFRLAGQVRSLMAEEVDGLVDVNMEQRTNRPELEIVPRRELLGQYGITMSQFNETLKTALLGREVSEVYEGNRRFGLALILEPEARGSMERLMDVMMDTPQGQKVPLSSVADVVSLSGPHSISRENVSRKVVVSANLGGGDLGGTVRQMRSLINEHIQLPQGYHIEYGGQFESQERASRTLYLASLLSLLVIFLLLEMEFHDAGESLIVLLNLPLAIVGGVLVLMLTTREVSIPAIIGFISLFGIATRNGMLLLSSYKSLTRPGCDVRKVVLSGSMERLNPILMTALTSALALIPLAFRSDLPGNEIQSPMAKVILGGLITSTALNAFIIPLAYEYVKTRNRSPQRLPEAELESPEQ